MGNAEVQRLARWNQLWLVVLLLVALGWAGSSFLQHAQEVSRSLRASWDAGVLRLRSSSDGPFIVTHLVFWGDGGLSKAYAVLPEPILIIDSGGARIDKEELRNLRWRSYRGGPAPVPPEGAPITALYYRPLQTMQP